MDYGFTQTCTGRRMNSQTRTAVVLVALVASMTLGSLVLLALDQSSLTGSAYSLSSYLRLDTVEEAALRPIAAAAANWSRVEVYYSRTTAGSVADLALVSHLRGTDRGDFHFVIGNGRGADDGQIQCTTAWKNQQSAAGIIRICIVADPYESPVTDSQVRRTDALVDTLCRTFGINAQALRFPADWGM
jgi:hypothetical protein